MLTNKEFARLESYRVGYKRDKNAANKRPTQLALEHIEALSEQHARALRLIETMVKLRRESLCYRVPAFFAVTWARIKYVFRKR